MYEKRQTSKNSENERVSMRCYVPYSTNLKHWNEINIENQYIMVQKGQQTCLDCMFCFPKVRHVIILQRIVSFKIRLIHVYMHS